jgi:hypothetical protein
LKTNLRDWRSAVAALRKRPVVLTLAALALTGAVGGSVAAALAEPPASTLDAAAVSGTPSANARPDPSVQTDTATDGGQQTTAPAQAAVDHAFELQPNYYYCGPAATRVALSAHGKVFSEDQLAAMLDTTTAGTPSAFDITRVLNMQLGEGHYRTVELARRQVTPKQTAQLQSDVVTSLSHGDTLVANVMGDGTDTSGHRRSYPVGHYLNVVGYVDQGAVAQIADSADPQASHYEIAVAELAQWIGSRGYSTSNG